MKKLVALTKKDLDNLNKDDVVYIDLNQGLLRGILTEKSSRFYTFYVPGHPDAFDRETGIRIKNWGLACPYDGQFAPKGFYRLEEEA